MNMMRLLPLTAACSLWFLAGCGGVEAPMGDDSPGHEAPASPSVHVEGEGPEHEHGSPGDPDAEVSAMACQASYHSAITRARELIRANCSSISACGNNDSFSHHDLKLSDGDYCQCYNYIWNNRGSYPWTDLQVIYHERYACTWNHIHLRVVNTCGTFHLNLDEGYGGSQNDCYDNESSTYVDKYFCSAGSRKGTCNN